MPSQTKSDPSIINSSDLEKARLIWDEYKYRHEHIWKLIFQITTAVVALGVIPFTNADIAASLGAWMVALPALGCALALFSLARMSSELTLLEKIKRRHRQYQADLQGISFAEKRSSFSRDVKLYLGALALVTLLDILAILLAWIPNL
ncbi:MAG: hypothetical protein HY867_04125 [Chloroflexi bacterium]|nr:hypothetical protein [Chloroflexota bacterium]